ncbi:MAG: PEP-CTERM sorting domain-containing protein [Burkholderiales bacterium]
MTGEDPSNTGTLVAVSGTFLSLPADVFTTGILLQDEEGNPSMGLAFGYDRDPKAGGVPHRLNGHCAEEAGMCDRWAGEGWLNYSLTWDSKGFRHIGANDWLFTGVRTVPEPGSVALFGAGLGLMTLVMMRRKVYARTR